MVHAWVKQGNKYNNFAWWHELPILAAIVSDEGDFCSHDYLSSFKRQWWDPAIETRNVPY